MNMALHHRLSSVPLIIRIVGLYLATALFFTGLLALQPSQPTAQIIEQRREALSAQVEVITQQEEIRGTPARLVVDRLALDLPVKDGTFDPITGEWTLSDTDAFYATMTDAPSNRPGSTFIYGHNRPAAFGPLQSITAGDTVTIFTTSGAKLIYTYREDAVVTPEFTSILYEDSDVPQLILMTCEGLWSEVRRVMYFTLSEATA